MTSLMTDLTISIFFKHRQSCKQIYICYSSSRTHGQTNEDTYRIELQNGVWNSQPHGGRARQDDSKIKAVVWTKDALGHYLRKNRESFIWVNLIIIYFSLFSTVRPPFPTKHTRDSVRFCWDSAFFMSIGCRRHFSIDDQFCGHR